MRPSLIALQMPLSEEDEVFVEKCFQRSLLVSVTWPARSLYSFFLRLTTCFFFSVLQELEKLISFSGTPTCVWRRTGEICLVGDEFCLLTEWSKDELLDPHGSSVSEDNASSADEHAAIAGCRKKFIYEVSSHVASPESLRFQIRSLVTSECIFCLPYASGVPVRFAFPLLTRFRFPFPSILSTDLAFFPFIAIREPISGRILGKLCIPCIREHDSVCRIPLCVAETEWGSCPMHVLFFDKTGYHGFTEYHHW